MRDLIKGADEVFIVSPYLMESFDVIFDEILDTSGVKRVTLVTTLKDNDPDLFKKADSLHSFLFNCIAYSIEFRIHIDNKLHGKIYIACKDSKPIRGIITSANFTDLGLSHNHEWGVVINDPISLIKVLDDITKISSRAITHSELNEIIAKIDSYSQNIGVPKKPTVDLEVSSLLKHKVPKGKSDLRYFIKPVGYSDKPFELTRKLSRDIEKMHFAKTPSSVRTGDILICYAVGTTRLLGYFEVISDPYIWDNSSRWPWEVEAQNLSPNYSDSWLSFENTVSSIKASFNSNLKITYVGGKTLGALQFGSDKIRLTEEFAKHVINIIDDSV